MIPFLDLKQVTAPYREDLLEAITRVLDSGWFVNGVEVKKFELEFAEFCGTSFCAGVGNGFDALNLTLRAWIEMGYLQEGDEVIIPSTAYIASLLAVTQNRLLPVFVEAEPDSSNIDATKISDAITAKTRVIMPVHLFGELSNMPEIMKIAEQHKLLVLEDCAQAHGASINGRRAGSWGDAAAFSFYPTKNLGALGDAGCITSDDEQLVEVARSLRNYGSTKKYQNDYKGVNSRLDEMQAAVLRVKLKHLETDNSGRRKIAKHYLSHIKQKLITLPRRVDEARHVWHLFVVAVEHREEFRSFLLERGVQTDIHYPIAPHHQLAYSELRDLSFPLSEKRHREVVSLPISPVMDIAQADEVVTAVNAFGM